MRIPWAFRGELLDETSPVGVDDPEPIEQDPARRHDVVEAIECEQGIKDLVWNR